MMGLTTQLRYRNLLACTAVILGLLAAAWVMAAPDTTAKPATVDTSKEKTALSQAFRKSTELFSQNSDDSNKLDATIETAPLRTVLRQLSTVTGWRIFVEPGLSRNISAKFKNLPSHEALPLILGSLNYALVSDGKNGQRLLVFQKDQKAATEFVRPDLSKPIPNELIVVLKKGSKLTPEEIAKLIGGKVLSVSKDGTAIRFSFESEEAVAEAKEALAKLLKTDVDSIQDNYYVVSPEAALAIASGGLSVPKNITALPGDATTIAMIDSALHLDGINYADVLLDTIYFTADANQGLSSFPSHADSMLGSSITFLQSSGYDQLDIRYLPLVVTDASGTGDAFSVAQAVLYASNAGVPVINIPLCGNVYSPYLAEAINVASSNGAIILAATGNEPTNQPTYPASYNGVIGVTALENGSIAPYANEKGADAAVAGTALFYYNGSWYLTSGTSVSTTYASTLTALEVQTGKSASEAAESLLNKFPYKN